MRRADAKKSKAGQYYLTHEEAEDLETLRRQKRRRKSRRQPARHVAPVNDCSLRELVQIFAIAVLVLLVLYFVLEVL